MKEYRNIMRSFSKEYQEGNHREIPEDEIEKYLAKDFKKITLENNQRYTFDKLIGRFSSSSYSPKEGTSEYDDSYNSLKKAFSRYKIDNEVIFRYDSDMYIGRI